jgi:homoserine dehydrogenase
MKNNKLVKIGILGLGVVGSELVSLIRKNALRIQLETGVKIEISKVYVRTMHKTRDIELTGLKLTTDSAEIINDPTISIVCECIGGNGFEQSARIVEACLKQKKHLIMSSKKTLAKYANTLLDAAYQNKVALKYDATVGGGIPIAKVLEHSFKGDELTRIYGVFNATSNFIYSKMYDKQQSFDSALKEAQDKGYAENDPSDDVNGFDSLYKLVILTMFGIKKIINPDLINPESFTHINVKDMEYAHELGYRIKPLSALAVQRGGYSCKVSPFLVPEKHLVAQATDNFNAIIMEGKKCGELGFYGQGAGAGPTATAMFDDLISLFSPCDNIDIYPYSLVDKGKVDDLPSRYYLRYTVKNEAGILSKISGLLASLDINIERIIQKIENTDDIEIVMLTSRMNKTTLENIQTICKSKNLTIPAVYPIVD